MNEKESKNSIQVIERMMRLLDVLAQSPDAVSLKLASGKAELHPSTAHRILTALVRDRMVERVDQGSYRLGMRLLELGNLVKSRISVREHALPFMRELHAATGEAVNLSVRRDDEIVYIERTSSGRSLMRVVNIIGARAPLHITAVGKLFLLEDGAEGLKTYAERTALPAFTKNTIHALPALEKELDRVRRQGYAIDNEEAELGVRCIGAGIRDDTGALVAGLSISSPAERMKPGWAAMVKDTAEKISRAIGYRGQAA
ncbi:MAG TPA: IclR family transcriptional regulator [Burkholderiales bacterium]|nr:IclR family transcriptional regulator [Burkholderiales bacterium]